MQLNHNRKAYATHIGDSPEAPGSAELGLLHSSYYTAAFPNTQKEHRARKIEEIEEYVSNERGGQNYNK